MLFALFAPFLQHIRVLHYEIISGALSAVFFVLPLLQFLVLGTFGLAGIQLVV